MNIGREESYIFSSGNSDNDAVPDEHTKGKKNPETRKKRKRRSRERNSISKKCERLV